MLLSLLCLMPEAEKQGTILRELTSTGHSKNDTQNTLSKQ